MHIPDGFLSRDICGAMGMTALAVVGYCIRKVRLTLFERVKVLKRSLVTVQGPGMGEYSLKDRLSALGKKKASLMGVVGGFIFAAQMLNFPVNYGTSGHLVGGVLTAILLGPFAAALVMTIILVVQAFLFADGGILALGANVFNMGILATIGGYYLYYSFKKMFSGKPGLLFSAFIASWFSVVLAALACSFELGFSGSCSLSQILPTMINVHILIGLTEALITVGILTFIFKTKPELLKREEQDEN
jgi:cobalt/nickel transport system permease protein